ncbi:MAG: succinate dehydrogenase/fumarate reductase iron-sulfur subunit [Methanomicrobiaceae archaeon]|nr:succinate dehydrogenase/fumarate reductase iron-sulfur subunit [Methanomicrobiaceae archaeon]
MKLIVYRYREGMEEPRYDRFELEAGPGLTVLGALFEIQERFDDSLAFRYSCRGAVCGSCAMLINKIPRLACRTQVTSLLGSGEKSRLSPYPGAAETVSFDPEEEVLVEPLPHLPVIRDLVVDMDAFYGKYRFIEPVFRPAGPAPEEERRMDPEDVHALETYTNCILCAACYGACPVDGKDPEYLGPAALAKLYRFHLDPREGEGARLERADIPHGWWACEFHGNCRQVCPRGVPPIQAIGKARQELEGRRR